MGASGFFEGKAIAYALTLPARLCPITDCTLGRAAQRKRAVFYPLSRRAYGGPLGERNRFSIGNLFLRGA
jgi:hypothetical protein